MVYAAPAVRIGKLLVVKVVLMFGIYQNRGTNLLSRLMQL